MADIVNYLNVDRLTIYKLITLVLVLIILIFIKKIIQKSLTTRIKNKSVGIQHKIKKILNLAFYLMFVLTVFALFSEKVKGISIYLGVASAGIAFALQEVLLSFVGTISIILGNYFRVGDRIKFGEIRGDVIDLGILKTTLMELGDWVDGDLYNGKVVRVSNSNIFKGAVHNYSGDFPFLWDEVFVYLMNDSNLEEAIKIAETIGKKEQQKFVKSIERGWDHLVNKFSVENARTDSFASVSYSDSMKCIKLTLRYVVNYKERRKIKSLITKNLVRKIYASDNNIKLAYDTLELTKFENWSGQSDSN